MSHLVAPAQDVVADIRDALVEEVLDETTGNPVKVLATIDPEAANRAIAGDLDVVVLVGVPTLEWTTYTAHDAQVPVHLIAASTDYLRAWRHLDAVLTRLVDAAPDLVPTRARPTTYQATPAAPTYPALTLTITQPRT